MKKLSIPLLLLFSLFNVADAFASFNYLEADQFKEWLTGNKPVIIVDIQVEDEFAAHHFPGSIETNAFPVKSDGERDRIAPAVKAFKDTGHDVVVVCPRGGGGAKRCYSYLKEQGIPEEKLSILKGGIDKWPYREMLVTGH